MGKNIRSPHFRWQDKQEGYDYEFDVPCMPDIDFPCFKWDEDFEEDFSPGHDMKVLRYNNKSQSLSDIIGDIPMDRVKSYSIKERKNGKRIIIDIEDAPLFEKQDRVIIMREPGRQSHKRTIADPQMKVIIKSDDSDQTGEPWKHHRLLRHHLQGNRG